MEFLQHTDNQYFQNLDTVIDKNPQFNINKQRGELDSNEQSKKQFYEFIPFHPATVTSEMVGTSVEELYQHNYPNKRSWECSRLCSFPQELVLRLDHRSHIKYVLLRSKVNRPSPEIILYIGDGSSGSYLDAQFRKFGTCQGLTEEGQTVRVDGIGNYIKLVFTKQARKTLENPFGQISLSQCKLFGKEINHLIYYDELSTNLYDDEYGKDDIDNILIDLGLPLNDPIFFITDSNYEISPVDEETKWTLKDMLLILRRAEYAKDYEMMKRIKIDIKRVYFIGNEILNLERKIKFAKTSNNFDLCIELREKIEQLNKKRDNYDAVYETTRFEQIVAFKRPSTADLLADEEERLRKIKDQKDSELKQKIIIEKEKKERLENERSSKQQVYTQFQDNSKFVSYVKSELKAKKNEYTDEMAYNQGDKDLEPFFNPLARKAKTKVELADKSTLERLKRLLVLNVAGVRLFSAMLSSDWTLREAAILAFHEFIRNPLLPRYFDKTINLFNCSIELAKIGVDDKVTQIYIESLQLIATALNPPICGNDIPPNHIQKQIKYFIPIIIKKISELNLRQRDHSLLTLITIFKHPALNIGDLIKGCMDIVEQKDKITPDKQPSYVLLARLEIILRVLEEFGVDDSLWDWYPVFNEIIIPSLFHSNPDCKLVAQQICVLLYQIIGEDIRIMIEDSSKNIKPQIKHQLLQRMKEVDITNRRMNNTNFPEANNFNNTSYSQGSTNINNIPENELVSNSPVRDRLDARTSLDPIIEANNDNESVYSGGQMRSNFNK